MNAIPILMFGGFAVFAIIVSIYAKRQAEQRRLAFMELASQFGFEYLPDGLAPAQPKGFLDSLGMMFEASPEMVFVQRFAGFHPFGIGQGANVSNLIYGQRDGTDWYMFDYTYQTTTSNGKTTQTTTHHHSVVAARVSLSLPGLTLAPETVFHRIGNKLGVHELTFELEEFNRRYFIQCQEARLAHDLLHPRAIEYLMRQPVRHWQFGGMYILLVSQGQLDPMEFGHKFAEIQGFLQLVPDYVRQDRGFTPTWRSPLD